MAEPIVALDLGGTRLKAGLVRAGTAEVLARDVRPSAGLDVDGTLSLLRETVHGLAPEGASGIGLAVPGSVEGTTITSLPGKFPGIEGRDLRDALGLDVPMVVVNDAVAYAIGEARHGSGRGAGRVVVVTIGTGVGVCVIEDGLPLGAGTHGGGVLGGQIPIGDPGRGPVDTSGRRGTIEARCGVAALLSYAAEAGAERADPAAVYTAAREGVAGAVAATETYRGWLARAIVALAHAHAPEVLVLGGGPVDPEAPWLEGLDELVGPRLWRGYAPRLRTATLGDDAALVGLGDLAARRSGS